MIEDIKEIINAHVVEELNRYVMSGLLTAEDLIGEELWKGSLTIYGHKFIEQMLSELIKDGRLPLKFAGMNESRVKLYQTM